MKNYWLEQRSLRLQKTYMKRNDHVDEIKPWMMDEQHKKEIHIVHGLGIQPYLPKKLDRRASIEWYVKNRVIPRTLGYYADRLKERFVLDHKEAAQDCFELCMAKAHRFDPKKSRPFPFFSTIVLSHLMALNRVKRGSILPPWNTSYSATDLDAKENADKQDRITYPNIYGFKSFVHIC